jgi:AGCS family alanine or glycine:cation symporter
VYGRQEVVGMAGVEKLLESISNVVRGPPLLILLFGTHLYLTVRLGFIQRYIGRAIRLSLARESEGEGDVSHFGALTTALAATIGTGNIVGVATAVAAGGPGAVFWMGRRVGAHQLRVATNAV